MPFAVQPAEIEEDVAGDGGRPERAARRLAAAKARAVAEQHAGALVLAADTVVALRGVLLGKPAGAEEAAAMLRGLRGRTHRVVTAVAVAVPVETPRRGVSMLVGHFRTVVAMRPYSEEEIAASIARGDPFDKAGAYGIQDALFAPVESYDGCYCNVVGLPLWPALALLRRAGLDITHVRATDLLPQCAGCPLRPPS